MALLVPSSQVTLFLEIGQFLLKFEFQHFTSFFSKTNKNLGIWNDGISTRLPASRTNFSMFVCVHERLGEGCDASQDFILQIMCLKECRTWTKRRVSSTLLPTGRSFMVICLERIVEIQTQKITSIIDTSGCRRDQWWKVLSKCDHSPPGRHRSPCW